MIKTILVGGAALAALSFSAHAQVTIINCDKIPTLDFIKQLAQDKGMLWQWRGDQLCLVIPGTAKGGGSGVLLNCQTPTEAENEMMDRCD